MPLGENDRSSITCKSVASFRISFSLQICYSKIRRWIFRRAAGDRQLLGLHRVPGHRLGDTEIREVDVLVVAVVRCGQHNVGRLDISVDDVVTVGKIQCCGDPLDDVRTAREGGIPYS